MLLASEYANPAFDYHNQLMYESQRECVFGCAYGGGGASTDCLCFIASVLHSGGVYSHHIFS